MGTYYTTKCKIFIFCCDFQRENLISVKNNIRIIISCRPQHKKDAERKLRNENAHVADVMVVRQLSSDTLLANMDTGDDNDDPLPSSPTHVAFERKGALAVCQGEKFLRPHMVLASNKRRTVAAENSR